MKLRRGENAPFSNSSRSQSCRSERSHEGQSRDCSRNSDLRSSETIRSIRVPPCGGLRCGEAPDLTDSVTESGLVSFNCASFRAGCPCYLLTIEKCEQHGTAGDLPEPFCIGRCQEIFEEQLASLHGARGCGMSSILLEINLSFARGSGLAIAP